MITFEKIFKQSNGSLQHTSNNLGTRFLSSLFNTRPWGGFPALNSNSRDTDPCTTLLLRVLQKFWAKFQTLVWSGRQFPESKIHVIFKADVRKDGSVIAGTSKKAAQQNDETELNHDVASAFEHIQRSRKEIDPENSEHELSADDSDIGERYVHGKELRDFNSHHSTDDEDTRIEWKHFQTQLHSNGKNDDEFGYITNAEEDDDSEENYDESLSGERDYDHAHIKTLHVSPKAKQKKRSRDGHVIGKIVGEEDEAVEDGLSGEGQGLNSIYDRRDLQLIEQSEDHEGSLIDEDEEDMVNLSGAEGYLARDEDKILEEDDGDTVLQSEKGF